MFILIVTPHLAGLSVTLSGIYSMLLKLPTLGSLSMLGVLLLVTCCSVLFGLASGIDLPPPIFPPPGGGIIPPPDGGGAPQCTPATAPPPVLRPLDNDEGRNLFSLVCHGILYS